MSSFPFCHSRPIKLFCHLLNTDWDISNETWAISVPPVKVHARDLQWIDFSFSAKNKFLPAPAHKIPDVEIYMDISVLFQYDSVSLRCHRLFFTQFAHTWSFWLPVSLAVTYKLKSLSSFDVDIYISQESYESFISPGSCTDSQLYCVPWERRPLGKATKSLKFVKRLQRNS